jgi:hypothetical protein
MVEISENKKAGSAINNPAQKSKILSKPPCMVVSLPAPLFNAYRFQPRVSEIEPAEHADPCQYQNNKTESFNRSAAYYTPGARGIDIHNHPE